MPQRISFTRGAWIAFGAFALLQVGLLGVQVTMLEDQRSTVDRQLETAVRQSERAIPLMETVKPLAEEARGAGPALRRLNGETLELTDALTPLAKDLRNARADEQLRAAGALARTLLGAELPEMAAQVRSFLERMGEERVVEKSARAAEAVPGDVVPLLRRSVSVQEQTLAAQREGLAVQREALALIRETLTVARETERHAESIDRKTGGSPPVAAGTTGP